MGRQAEARRHVDAAALCGGASTRVVGDGPVRASGLTYDLRPMMHRTLPPAEIVKHSEAACPGWRETGVVAFLPPHRCLLCVPTRTLEAGHPWESLGISSGLLPS